MAQAQLLYLGTSKTTNTIQSGQVVKGYDWGSYSGWTTFKKPTASKKSKVNYDDKKKDVAGTKFSGFANGGVTKFGTAIPATAQRPVTIAGVTQTINAAVRYQMRGYTIYERPKSLKKGKKNAWKMYKSVYNNSNHAYQYRLQYKDNPQFENVYTSYASGFQYVYFADKYYNTTTKSWVTNQHHAEHPTTFKLNYSDVRKNLESNTNNSDGRDNRGTYVLSTVRTNVTTLELEWTGLTKEQGQLILNTLNPTNTYKYILAQYYDLETGGVTTRNFIPSDRKVEMYPNGMYKSISVTLTEV